MQKQEALTRGSYNSASYNTKPVGMIQLQGYNSNITIQEGHPKENLQNLVESKVTEEDEAAESGREEPAQTKPPKIPSLKGKIY